MDKIKLQVVIPTGYCFGLQNITLDLFSICSDSLDPYFLITRWSDGEFQNRIEKIGFKYEKSWLGMYSRKLEIKYLWMTIQTLMKLPILYFDFLWLKKKFKPDLFYFANYHELVLLWPLLIFNKIPVVCHMHDPPPNIYFQRLLFRIYNRTVNQYIVISNDVKFRMSSLGCDPSKLHLIYNGIRVRSSRVKRGSLFTEKFNWQEADFIIGITGQMTEVKGHDVVIKALREIRKKQTNIRLIIGGRKIPPYSNFLDKLIIDSGLDNDVKYSGWLEDVDDFYANIDALILASRHSEGFGLVLAEAMSHGKPVISTRSGGSVEIFENGKSGFLIEKNDYVELSSKIELLVNDRRLYERFSKEALERVKMRFSIDVMQEEFLSLLKYFKSPFVEF